MNKKVKRIAATFEPNSGLDKGYECATLNSMTRPEGESKPLGKKVITRVLGLTYAPHTPTRPSTINVSFLSKHQKISITYSETGVGGTRELKSLTIQDRQNLLQHLADNFAYKKRFLVNSKSKGI